MTVSKQKVENKDLFEVEDYESTEKSNEQQFIIIKSRLKQHSNINGIVLQKASENGRYAMYDVPQQTRNTLINSIEDSNNVSLEGTSETVSANGAKEDMPLTLVNMQKALNVYGHNVKNKTAQISSKIKSIQ